MKFKSDLGVSISGSEGEGLYKVEMELVSMLVPCANITVCKNKVCGFLQINNSEGVIVSRFRLKPREVDFLHTRRGFKRVGYSI